jgi:hypothetical protein
MPFQNERVFDLLSLALALLQTLNLCGNIHPVNSFGFIRHLWPSLLGKT